MTKATTKDQVDQFLQDVLDGLSRDNKTLPCKYFYDDRGSKIFEQICDLDEYYLTRTELNLLNSIKQELADAIGNNAAIVEPGAGAGRKVQILLAALNQPAAYLPMDISKEILFRSSSTIKARFPRIQLMPLCSDFTRSIEWPSIRNLSRRVVFFPGSTLGNFDPDHAVAFLKGMARLVGDQGLLIVGIDLIKPVEVLEAAYNDRSGITEAFNKNILVRINCELGADFDLESFSHRAFYNSQKQRIEMHLQSEVDQSVRVNGHRFTFFRQESIHTENSYKYSISGFQQLARRAGLIDYRYWVDEHGLFSIHLLQPG